MEILLFIVALFVVPTATAALILGILWRFFGRKIMLIGLLLIIVGIGGFFSYFRFGRDLAITTLAIQKNDPSICSRLLKELIMPTYDPKKDCLREVAVTNKNVDACKEGGVECYRDVALKYDDISVCDAAADIATKEFCFQITLPSIKVDKNFVARCESMQDLHRKGDCYMNVAIDTNNPDLCYQHLPLLSIQKCYEYFGNKFAIKGKADLLCPEQKAYLSGGDEACYRWFAITTGDSLLCNHLPSDVSPGTASKEDCLREVNAHKK
ncbi:MAG TPA: hypothetical protein VI873_02515 [Candidatus Peribacteraceae bacterium]|nr:hypothetical protein [Candidatus Peribacteraceae bacterium]